MLKFSIGLRLFLGVLVAFILVGVLGIELVRWNLSSRFVGGASRADVDRLDRLGMSLASRYEAHHDWSFLPADPLLRKTWPGAQLGGVGGAPGSVALEQRVGLLDADGRLLAGAVAHPALVALASIDTVQRPFMLDGRPIGTLVLSRADDPRDDLAVAFLIDRQAQLAVLAAVGLVMAVIASALLAANFRRPIGQLVQGARSLGAGRFEARLGSRRSDELGELARSFDRLAAQLQAAEASRRDWVANTSHELRTPLAVLRGQLEALQDGIRAATPAHIESMLRQVNSLGALVDDLYQLAASDAGAWVMERQPVDAWRLLGEVAGEFAARLHEARLAIAIGPAPARSVVLADVARLRQLMVNLLENSVRHTDAGGRIELHAAAPGAELRVTIDDASPAVPPALLPRLGERFFRVDASRARRFGGAGLGLALCREIVEAQDGRLAFAASPLGGLRVLITLPLHD